MVRITLPSGNSVETNFASTNPILHKIANGSSIFCFCDDNSGIEDENNDLFYIEKEIPQTGDDENKKVRVFKDNVTVKSEDGQTVYGCIEHWCPMGGESGPRGWFMLDATEKKLAIAQN
jgi:hypothetical protein